MATCPRHVHEIHRADIKNIEHEHLQKLNYVSRYDKIRFSFKKAHFFEQPNTLIYYIFKQIKRVCRIFYNFEECV